MAWRFEQKTGRVLQTVDINSARFSHMAYSGGGDGRNNPALQHLHGVGPIPVGFYDIGKPEESKVTGHYILRLKPHPGTNTFGRGDFEWHGDNSSHTASHGCIISSPQSRREEVVNSGDTVLEVVSGIN